MLLDSKNLLIQMQDWNIGKSYYSHNVKIRQANMAYFNAQSTVPPHNL
jgi:hypothetical protein